MILQSNNMGFFGAISNLREQTLKGTLKSELTTNVFHFQISAQQDAY